jgi:hypothetical protein
MAPVLSPAAVVQRQLDAYNARDLSAWLETYADTAQQYELPGTLLASGHAAIKSRGAQRFTDPHLHARLVARAVMGQIVIDHEVVTMTFPDGLGAVELVCVYKVDHGKIQHASFAFGPRLDMTAPLQAP